MKTFWILAISMTLMSAVRAQHVEHAPTVEQCRADQALWDDKIAHPAKDWANSVPEISSRSLNVMLNEMVACVSVDAVYRSKYNATSKVISLVVGDRAMDFLIRHNLKEKFYQEDDSGRR